MSSTAPRIDLLRCALLVRWRQIHEPFEQWKFLRILPEQGYVIPRDVTDAPMSFGSRSEVTGRVGTKGSISLLLDSSRPGIQLEGLDVSTLIEEFDAIETLLLDQFDFDSKANCRFYEVDAQALIWSQNSPIDILRRRTSGLPAFDDVASVVNLPLAGFGLKLSSPKDLPGDEEWAELQIEPSIRSPRSAYFSVLILRQNAKEAVWDMASRIPMVFGQIVEKLEG